MAGRGGSPGRERSRSRRSAGRSAPSSASPASLRPWRPASSSTRPCSPLSCSAAKHGGGGNHAHHGGSAAGLLARPPPPLALHRARPCPLHRLRRSPSPAARGRKARDMPGVADPRDRVGLRLQAGPPRTTKNAALVCRSSTRIAGHHEGDEAAAARLRAIGTGPDRARQRRRRAVVRSVDCPRPSPGSMHPPLRRAPHRARAPHAPPRARRRRGSGGGSSCRRRR